MARRVITLKGVPHLDEDGAAGVAITPGHLVQGVATIQLHASAGGVAAKRFALERDERGDDIDTAYAVGDYVKVGSYSAGDRVYPFLASGENVAADSFLESNGDGTLRAYAAGEIVGRALEAVNASGGVTRIRIEVF
jgi:hypothetical protein